MMNIYDISQARALQLLRIAAQEIIEYNGEYAWAIFQGMGLTIPELQALDALPEYTAGEIEYSDGNFAAVFEISAAMTPLAAWQAIDEICAEWHNSVGGDDAWWYPCAEWIEKKFARKYGECECVRWEDLMED